MGRTIFAADFEGGNMQKSKNEWTAKFANKTSSSSPSFAFKMSSWNRQIIGIKFSSRRKLPAAAVKFGRLISKMDENSGPCYLLKTGQSPASLRFGNFFDPTPSTKFSYLATFHYYKYCKWPEVEHRIYPSMELLSRRRWLTGSAQKSNKYGMLQCMWCILFFWGGVVINTTAYHWGKYSLHLLILQSSMNSVWPDD